MPAPGPATLRRFLLGTLPAAEAGPVEAFLTTDPAAATVLDALRAEDPLVAALRGRTGAPAVPPEAEALARRLESLPAEPTHSAAADSSGEPTGARTRPDLTAFLGPPAGPGELGRLGDFRVLRVLGHGGMGVVFEAEDTRLGRRVAVKAMLPAVAAGPAARARFLREAASAAAVEHDHVVPIHRIDEANGVPFIVMPFLQGESLDDRLRRERTLPVAEVVRVGREVAEGLAAAHARGLVHRDIKPGNLWLEAPRGRVRILDFGLARPAGTGAGPEITQSGTVIGTPAYMSPEQGRGQPVDFRTDLFSLGGVLYRACTGRTPFTGADPAGMLMAVAADTPADPREYNPQVPGPLAALILSLLAKDPAALPASAREVARRLAPAVEALPGDDGPRPEFAFDDTEVIPPPAPRAAPRRYGLWVSAAVGALVVGLGLLFAPTVVRLATNKGELVIEVDDPRVEVVVRGAEAEVRDRSRDRRYVLRAGDGQVEFLDPDGGAGGLTKAFTVTRGGKTVVRATLAEVALTRPKPIPKAAPPVPPAPAARGTAGPLPPVLVDGGDWRLDGDELVQARPGIAALMFGDPAWTDYDLAVETKTLPGPAQAQGPLLYFRATARNNYMNFNLGSYGGQWDEVAYVWDGKWGRDVNGVRAPHQSDRWYRMAVRVRGNRVQCSLDGQQLFDFENDQFPAGFVGLGTWNTSVRWRNLTVTAPDGKVFLRGFPRPPFARLVTPLGMEFALVPRGKAWLGGGGGRPGTRQVEFPDDFYLGVYPVTQGEWEKVTGTNPAHFSRHGFRKELVKDIPDAELKRFPVEGVSIADVEAFLAKLNEQAKDTGWVYRLPTSDEWEYACRGGPVDRAASAFRFYVGEPSDELPRDKANYAYPGSSNRTCKVGLHPPNRLGLHDMHANVLEWCSDAGRNAQGEETRLARGGSWNDPPGFAGSHLQFLPTVRYASLGLRVARVRAPKG